MKHIGILLERKILLKNLQGKRTYERIDYYKNICNKLGIEPAFFHSKQLRFSDRKVHAYIFQRGRLSKKIIPIPTLIHNRVLGNGSIIRKLGRKYKIFNGIVKRDKAVVYRLLVKNRSIKSHLPVTKNFGKENLLLFLKKYKVVYIKPRIGSVGIGVVRIERHGNQCYFISSKKRVALSKEQLLQTAKRWVGNRKFIIQRGIMLSKYRNRTFDIRVSVQKNGQREWVISGMVAKLSNNRNKLSNLSQGGKAVSLNRILVKIFNKNKLQKTKSRIRSLGISIAKQLEKYYPNLADLGLDIGIDNEGIPYLIEVNFRDQRYSFKKANEIRMFKNTYRNPMKYGNSFLQ